MKKVITILLIFVLLSTTVAFAASVNGSYKDYPIVNVTLNDAKVSSNVPAIVLDGSTLLPTRAIAEALNCYVKWDQPTMTAKIIKPTVNMIFFGDSKEESDGTWNLTNVGCSNDALGTDKFANFYIEIGPMDGKEYEYRVVAYDPNGNALKSSETGSATFSDAGTMIKIAIDSLTYSKSGAYTFKFQIKYDGEFRSVGEATAVIE